MAKTSRGLLHHHNYDPRVLKNITLPLNTIFSICKHSIIHLFQTVCAQDQEVCASGDAPAILQYQLYVFLACPLSVCQTQTMLILLYL